MVGVLFDRPINCGTADTIFLSKALTPTKISDNYSNGYVSCHFCYKENGLKPPTMTGLLYESLDPSLNEYYSNFSCKSYKMTSPSVQMSFYYSPLRCIYPHRSKSHWESSCCWTRSCASVTVLPSRRSCPGRWSLASCWCLSSTCLGKRTFECLQLIVLLKTTPKIWSADADRFSASTLNTTEQMEVWVISHCQQQLCCPSQLC